MVQHAALVVEAQKQRPHEAFTGLVPSKARDDAIGGAHVLDLEHRPPARLVGGIDTFGDNAIQARALEAP